MKRLSIFSLLFFCILLGLLAPLDARKKTKPFKTQEEGAKYLNRHYNLGAKYYNKKNWRDAADHFERVIYFFPDSEEAAEASYYLGVCYYEMKEYDFANKEFSAYITASAHPAFFEEAVEFKYCIAEHFKNGKKKRGFDFRYCPKWMSAEELALTIYDEIVIALPNHELTVLALKSKAELLRKRGEYRESIDTYQILIRRFPKSEYTPECYLKIAEVYYEQSKLEFQNPDLLAFAMLNARKFSEDFPRDERVCEANEYVQMIKEVYAKGLCNLGLFYERKGHPHAAAIYYKSSIAEFPDTDCAQFCKQRLLGLDFSKESKDVNISIATLMEELDPLAYEEKATPAEGYPEEGGPLVFEVDIGPQPGFVEPYIPEPEFEEEAAIEDELTEQEKWQDASDYLAPCEQEEVDEGIHFPPMQEVPVNLRESHRGVHFSEHYDQSIGVKRPSPPPPPPRIIDLDEEMDKYLGECFIEVEPQAYEAPITIFDPEYPFLYVEDEAYENHPHQRIGHEDDHYVTFENGRTIDHSPKHEEPIKVYKIVRKKEAPPPTYAHYSLLKNRPVKKRAQRADCR